MFEIDLEELLNKAESMGSVSGSEWEKGQYRMEIAKTNTGKTKDGKSAKVGLMWKNLSEPYAGESNWENLTLNKSNDTSVSIFVNKLLSLGLSKEFLRTKPALEQVAAMLEGVVADVEFSVEPWKSDPTKTGKRFKVVRLIDTSEPDAEADANDLFS